MAEVVVGVVVVVVVAMVVAMMVIVVLMMVAVVVALLEFVVARGVVTGCRPGEARHAGGAEPGRCSRTRPALLLGKRGLFDVVGRGSKG